MTEPREPEKEKEDSEDLFDDDLLDLENEINALAGDDDAFDLEDLVAEMPGGDDDPDLAMELSDDAEEEEILDLGGDFAETVYPENRKKLRQTNWKTSRKSMKRISCRISMTTSWIWA
jgi:hypothetical protein